MIGERVLVGLQTATTTTWNTIATTYPLSIDAAVCRGTVRNDCGANDNPPIPPQGLPASALDVIKANSGQLGDIVVLGTGYSDLVASPTSNPPDLTPFNTDFAQVMSALQAEPHVQKVVVLNLRTGDARLTALQVNKYTAINTRLTHIATAGTYPKMVLADYNTASSTWICAGPCFAHDPLIPAPQIGAIPFASWLKSQLDLVTATRGNDGEAPVVGNRCLASNSFGVAPFAGPTLTPQLPDGAAFSAVTPLRMLDTRGGRQLGSGQIRRLQVAGVGNGVTDIPANARAVALNVTATGECGNGFLTVFPCGPTPPPNASNVNFLVGQNVPNAVTVRVGELGRVCVYTSAQTDVIVDIDGFYNTVDDCYDTIVTDCSLHFSVNPTRIVDTRIGLGGGVLLANTARTFDLRRGVSPYAPTAVALNVTAVGPTGAGFLTVFRPDRPCEKTIVPSASNLNYRPGQVVANYVVVKASYFICVYSSAATHLLVDVNAAFSSPGGSTFKAGQPTRVVDTRPTGSALLHGGVYSARLQPNLPLVVPVVTAAGLPANTQAVLLNTTVVGPWAAGYLSAYPCGTNPPNASNLNFLAGQTLPNLVDAKIGTGGAVCIVSSAQTDVLLDLTGYYSP
jgi:hypothetical protein